MEGPCLLVRPPPLIITTIDTFLSWKASVPFAMLPNQNFPNVPLYEQRLKETTVVDNHTPQQPTTYTVDSNRMSSKYHQQWLESEKARIDTTNRLLFVEAAFEQVSQELADAKRVIDSLASQLADKEEEAGWAAADEERVRQELEEIAEVEAREEASAQDIS